MNAADIAKALGGRRTGNGWSAPCPAHDDHTPSLSISEGADGKALLHCFAECEQSQVIAALRSRGLWRKYDHNWSPCPAPHMPAKENTAQDDARRTEAALAIWESAEPATGTLAEKYLASRKLILPPTSAIRFHPLLKHRTGRCWPAMVALVTHGTTGNAIGIHRTFLARDGSGKAAVVPDRMMLGSCRGGAVHLAELGDVLMVGEGLETCLAAMHATGKPAWAALSTSGLRSLELPSQVADVIVLADGDDAGDAAARDCAGRWHRQGRHVRIARPPRGLDFNDLMLGRTAPVEETAP